VLNFELNQGAFSIYTMQSNIRNSQKQKRNVNNLQIQFHTVKNRREIKNNRLKELPINEGGNKERNIKIYCLDCKYLDT